MKIAFCSCNHPTVVARQPGWLALAATAPDVLLLLGDNIYIEDGTHQLLFDALRPVLRLAPQEFAQWLHVRYALQFMVPEFRIALDAVGLVMGTLDDHDFLGNDFFVTASTALHAKVARVMHRQFIAACNQRPLPAVYPAQADWVNDADTGFAEGLGLAHSRSWGDTALVLLDNRSFRQPPGENAVVLGQQQIDWLAQTLAGPQTVSVVASGSPLTSGGKWYAPGSPLDDYPAEVRSLKALYQGPSHQVRVHLAGDLHYNACCQHPGFLEVVSSGMGTGWIPFAPVPNGNFGLIQVEPDQVRVCTYGNDKYRNYDIALSRTP